MRIILAYDRTRKGKVVKRGFHILMVMAAIMPWCASNSAETLGRLFFTPAQRSTLDAGKQLATPRKAAPSGPRAATLNGVVTRSDGERTVWVNGKAYYNGSPEGAEIKTSPATPANAEVRVSGQALAVRVKVGQQLDLNSGKVRESTRREPQAYEIMPSPAKDAERPTLPAKKRKAAESQLPESDEPAGDASATNSR